MSDYLELYDYRCRVTTMYRERTQALLSGDRAASVLQHFRETKDDLFANHPQSPLVEDKRQIFRGLNYFPYNPTLCFPVIIDTNVEPTRLKVVMNATEFMTMTSIGCVHFEVAGVPMTLSIYWLEVYGGGLFLPFRDATCPTESYGGGRYIFDTIKGNNLLPIKGTKIGKGFMLDFNYAYNPSCAYNDGWVCPLAPLENRLSVPIRAGEMNYKQ